MTLPAESTTLNTEEIMRRVREELQRRHGGVAALTSSSGDESGKHAVLSSSVPARLARISPPALERRNAYTREELLAYHDRDFIQQAYEAVLRRAPDAEGARHYLDRLRGGELTKVEILGRLRYSPEGRSRRIGISGLLLPFVVQSVARVPLLGYAVSSASWVIRLPRLVKTLQRLESHTLRIDAELIEQSNRQADVLEAVQRMLRELTSAELGAQLEAVRQTLEAKADREGVQRTISDVTAAAERSSAAFDCLQNALEAMELRLVSAEIEAAKAEPLSVLLDDHEQAVRGQREGLAELGRQFAAARTEQLWTRLEHFEQFGRAQQDELAELRRELASSAEEISALRLMLAQLEPRVDQATVAHTQISEELSRRIDGLGLQLGQWATSSNAQTLAESLSELQKCQSTLETSLREEVSAREARVAEFEREGEELRTQSRSTSERLQQVDIANAAARDELAAIRTQLLDYRRTLLDTQRRMSLLLEEARKRFPAVLNPEQLGVIAGQSDHQLDAFYASFEDHFRGTREDIKQRARQYLPLIQAAVAADAEAPIVDLGCGRGEWLELLAENQLRGTGVDLNDVMIAQCRELGLGVNKADALAYLRALRPNSVGAITAMHLIEHLPFATLIDLFDEALRVLRPGGLLIFETPNPENLQVGACYFYLDPTHRNPLPPPLVEFIAEARGFVGIEVLRLSEGRGNPQLFGRVAEAIPGASSINTLVDSLNGWMFAPPDYAIVARKA